MTKAIYKVVDTISKDEILSFCELADIPEFGDVMSYVEFIRNIKTGCIMDYDGDGYLVINDKIVDNSATCCDYETMYFEDKAYIPFEYLYSIFGDEMKFIWFNK